MLAESSLDVSLQLLMSFSELSHWLSFELLEFDESPKTFLELCELLPEEENELATLSELEELVLVDIVLAVQERSESEKQLDVTEDKSKVCIALLFEVLEENNFDLFLDLATDFSPLEG